MFLEIENSLKEVRSRYVGMSLNLQGSIRDFSDIEEMLKEERAQFEVSIFYKNTRHLNHFFSRIIW